MRWLRENLLDTPEGLLEQFRISASEFAMRYWIIDNSGSMQLTDGHRLVTSGGRTALVSSSRWAELCDSLEFHSKLAAHLYAPTEFRVLNEPAGVPSVIHVGYGDPQKELEKMNALMRTSPLGRTPLCHRIREVIAEIRQREPELRASGKRALVVIASDGEPSDGDVEMALRPLAQLPVFVVLRLCTEEDNVVAFWNQVDADLEISLEVLDDPVSEGHEVHDHAPYLTYALPLHRLREWGTSVKLLDVLDERHLTLGEVLDLVRFLFGTDDVAVQKLPHPEVNWRGFVNGLDNIQRHDRNHGKVYDPLRRKHSHWIHMHILNRHFGHGCAIM